MTVTDEVVAKLEDTKGISQIRASGSSLRQNAPGEMMVEFVEGGDGEAATSRVLDLMIEENLRPCRKEEDGPVTRLYLAEPDWWHLGEGPHEPEALVLPEEGTSE